MTEKLRLWLPGGLSEAWQTPTRTDSRLFVCLLFCFFLSAVKRIRLADKWVGRTDGCYLLAELLGLIPIRRLSMLLASPLFGADTAGTHFLDKARGYWLPVPVNGSLRNYDYVQPRAPRAGLSGATGGVCKAERHTQ